MATPPPTYEINSDSITKRNAHIMSERPLMEITHAVVEASVFK